jgi:hypothetical protein
MAIAMKPHTLLAHRAALANALHQPHVPPDSSGTDRGSQRRTRKAIDAYRELAGTAGADVAFVGQQLLGLSANLCYGGLPADSAAAAGAAADLRSARVTS